MHDLDGVYARLDAFIQRHMEAKAVPGVAVALTSRSETLRVSTYGFADLGAQTAISAGTLFQTGSIGKSFTSIALLKEYEEGQLDLHAPVTEYLPWFQVRSSYPPITIHHLLSHGAGITSGFDFSPDSRGQVWAMRNSQTGWAPGERFSYSNDGYKTLGLVLGVLTGEPYAHTIRARILDPLGMEATVPTITQEARKRMAVGYTTFYDDRPRHRDDPRVPATWFETDTADGCLASTAGDMAIYLRMLLNGGVGPHGRIMSEGSFELLRQRAIEIDSNRWYGYGLGTWEEEGHTIVGHGGGMPGFVTDISGDLGAGVGAVVLTNTVEDAAPIGEYGRRLLRAAVEGAGLPEPPQRIEPDVIEDASKYAGDYTARDGRRLGLQPDGNHLLLNWDGERVPLEPRGPDTFYVPHPDFALHLLQFGHEGRRVVEAWHGPDWYAGTAYSGPREFDEPAGWAAFSGHYRSFSPWLSNFRVFARKGRLLLSLPAFDAEIPLQPVSDCGFLLARDGMPPGDVTFGAAVDGQAISVNLMGGEYYWVETP